MPLAELEDACARETRRYLREGDSNSQFCLELFNRALRHAKQEQTPLVSSSTYIPVYHDEEARATLVRIYTPFIRAHISPALTRTVSTEDLIQHSWLKFWRAANSGLHFLSLGAALAYLKQTVISVQIAEQRGAWRRQREASLQQLMDSTGEDPSGTADATLFEAYQSVRFRARCVEVLEDPLQYRIFLMRYSMGIPPREIARVLIGEGVRLGKQDPSARAVSDLLERICRRLSADAEIKDLLQAD